MCLDPFHVIRLAIEALDEVCRETWNDARKGGQPGLAREHKSARFALWMNPDLLTAGHQQKVACVQHINKDTATRPVTPPTGPAGDSDLSPVFGRIGHR